MDLVSFLDSNLTVTPDNSQCNPQSPQVLGPILDGDEVIIGVVGLDGKSFGPLVPAPLITFLGTIFTMGISSDIDPVNGKISDEIPKFRINYLAEDSSTSGANNPLVFFTTSNPAQAKAGCVKKSTLSSQICTGLTNTTSVPNPGISVSSIKMCNNCPGEISSNKATSENRYLVPGAPVPLQLIPVNGERSWFPQTYPLPPAPSNSGKFALALSNVAYTINAIVGGKIYKNVSISTFFPGLLGTTRQPQNGAFLENTNSQQIYIIPTKYFSSNRGSELSVGSNCSDCIANPDEGWGAFCSIACRPQFKNGSSLSGDFSYNCNSARGSGSSNNCYGSCKYGFTQKQECKDRCFYKYCKSGKPRCNGDCKSPCGPTGPFMVTDSVCVLDNGIYGCVVSTGTTGSNENNGNNGNNGEIFSSIEIGIIVIVSSLLLGIVIYVIYLWSSEYNKPR